MRIIIEVEGGGSAQPEVVLRSSSGQSTADTTGRPPAAPQRGGIDAGAAPTGDPGTQTAGTVTPVSGVPDAGGAHSAGSAPSPDAGG